MTLSGATHVETLNGVEYTFSPLTDEKIQEVNNHIKGKILETAQNFCAGSRNQQVIDATMKAAMQETQKVDWILNPDLLQNVDTISYLLWVSVREKSEKITFSDWKNVLMADWEPNFEASMRAMSIVNPTLMQGLENI
jgi:hypothetical protein